jgi:hypothetical protein
MNVPPSGGRRYRFSALLRKTLTQTLANPIENQLSGHRLDLAIAHLGLRAFPVSHTCSPFCPHNHSSSLTNSNRMRKSVFSNVLIFP